MRALRRCPRNEVQPCLTWKLENGTIHVSVTPWEETCAQTLRFLRGCAYHRLKPPDNLWGLLSWLLDQAKLIPSNHQTLLYMQTLYRCMEKFSTFVEHKPKLNNIDCDALDVYFGIKHRHTKQRTDSIIECFDDSELKRIYKDHCELTELDQRQSFVNGMVIEGVQCTIQFLLPKSQDTIVDMEGAHQEDESPKPVWHNLIVRLGNIMW